MEQALEEAAEISGSLPFVRMRRAIRRAALSGRKPWSDLRDLGEELAVPELRNLADIAAVAADGASVYNTLLASARTLRHAELSDARSQANEVSERMSRPLALLVTGLTFFVLVPFLIRMFAGTRLSDHTANREVSHDPAHDPLPRPPGRLRRAGDAVRLGAGSSRRGCAPTTSPTTGVRTPPRRPS